MAVAKESAPTPIAKSHLKAQLVEKNGMTTTRIAAFLDSFRELAYSETRDNKKFVLPGLGILKL